MIPQEHQSTKTHQNVMESLVYGEIEKQLKFYPKNLKPYLNKVEVATYALNRLPPLYASSTVGREQQIRLGKQKYKEQLTTAVRRAIAAVERDPLRNSEPIISELEIRYEETQQCLQQVQMILQERNLLDYPKQVVTWENLPSLLQRALNKAEWSNQAPPRIMSAVPEPPPPPEPRRRPTSLDMGTLW
ncbi:MAG: late competence development ComFB family protein [Snowella sp.]|nr:late competence development ComFB family protein [Snowella sp.]